MFGRGGEDDGENDGEDGEFGERLRVLCGGNQSTSSNNVEEDNDMEDRSLGLIPRAVDMGGGK